MDKVPHPALKVKKAYSVKRIPYSRDPEGKLIKQGSRRRVEQCFRSRMLQVKRAEVIEPGICGQS